MYCRSLFGNVAKYDHDYDEADVLPFTGVGVQGKYSGANLTTLRGTRTTYARSGNDSI